jgi:hypothetical protein
LVEFTSEHLLNLISCQRLKAFFNFFNVHLTSGSARDHLPGVTSLVLYGRILKKICVALLLLFTPHASVVDKSIVQVIVLVIEVVPHFGVVHILNLLLRFFLFVCLREVSSVLLYWSETILQFEACYHRLYNILKLESVRAIFVVRRLVEFLKIAAIAFCKGSLPLYFLRTFVYSHSLKRLNGIHQVIFLKVALVRLVN